MATDNPGIPPALHSMDLDSPSKENDPREPLLAIEGAKKVKSCR